MLNLFRCFVFVCLFETEFLCVALEPVLELLLTRLASNSEITCLYFPSAGIKGVCHHCPAYLGIFTDVVYPVFYEHTVWVPLNRNGNRMYMCFQMPIISAWLMVSLDLS